jgi:beta-glucosidase
MLAARVVLFVPTRILVPLALIVVTHAALSSARLKPHASDMVRLTPASTYRQSAARAAAIVDSQALLETYTRAASPPDADVARRVRELIRRMTLKEKVGQMTQLEIGMVTDGQDADLHINPTKLRKAIADYGVGSILNVKDLALTVDTWHELISAIQNAAGETRLKIPVLYGLDTIHGANYVKGATLFPQPLGMAATWNPALMLAASRVAAAETRAAGIPWNFSPVLDTGRQPLWPRLYETFGEDVHLVSVMGAATVRGYQGDDPGSPTQVGACLKHYVGYSAPTSGHDRTPALIPIDTLREDYLPPFAAGVRAGALSVMVNSGEVNGIPGHADRHLLTDVLRGELGFDGVVVSDWEDIKRLVTAHHVSATEKDATRTAVLAGIDMSMVPSDYSFSELLVQLVDEGGVPLSRIDQAVSRVLTLKARLGLFDDPLRGIRANTAVGSGASRRLALEAARESIVLLKNARHVLPLAADARVFVTGPTCDSLPALNNGWTMTWQGDRPAEYPTDRPTVRRAIEARLRDRAVYLPGVDFDKAIDIPAAIAAARASDVVVACLGEPSYAETPGNIDELMLPDAQLRLGQALLDTGKPVVFVLIEGRPRIIRPIVDAAAAIVLALNPGMEGGAALADVLFGDVTPGGKLPITYPRFSNALTTYDHKLPQEPASSSTPTMGYGPQFEFGFGLSYTSFEYTGLTVAASASGHSAPVAVSVTVRNTGSRPGAEVVELFVSPRTTSVTPPAKRLKRFVKLTLQPNEARQISFELTEKDFSRVGAGGRPIVEPGAYSILVGGFKRELTFRR